MIPVQVGALLGPGELGSVAAFGELDAGKGHRDQGVVGVHGVAVHDPAAGDDVVVPAVVAVGRALLLGREAFPAAGPEVELGDVADTFVGLLWVAAITSAVPGLLTGEGANTLAGAMS